SVNLRCFLLRTTRRTATTGVPFHEKPQPLRSIQGSGSKRLVSIGRVLAAVICASSAAARASIAASRVSFGCGSGLGTTPFVIGRPYSYRCKNGRQGPVCPSTASVTTTSSNSSSGAGGAAEAGALDGRDNGTTFPPPAGMDKPRFARQSVPAKTNHTDGDDLSTRPA